MKRLAYNIYESQRKSNFSNLRRFMQRTISDIIEDFIMSSLDDDDFIELSRNDLAKFFSCVPSQINYVLNTRFTVNRGFLVESQRGGGGFIKVVRVQDKADNFLKNVLDACSKPMAANEANQIVDNLVVKKVIDIDESNLIKVALSTKSLNNPINMENVLRSNILSNIILELMKRRDRK